MWGLSHEMIALLKSQVYVGFLKIYYLKKILFDIGHLFMLNCLVFFLEFDLVLVKP